MKVIADDLWLCDDCTIVAVNGDDSGIDSDTRRQAVFAGLDRVSADGWLTPNDNGETGEGREEFSWSSCDCCNSRLGGSRTRFAILGRD